MILIEIYPIDGPDRFTYSRTSYINQIAVPHKGDLVYAGKSPVYRVIDVTWLFGEYSTKVVVRVKLAYPPKVSRWKKRGKDE